MPGEMNDLERIKEFLPPDQLAEFFPPDRKRATREFEHLQKRIGRRKWLKSHKLEIGLGAAVVSIVGGVIGLAIYNNYESAKTDRYYKRLAVNEVLQDPYELKILGICPDELENEATQLSGTQASLYRAAAIREQQLGFLCTSGATTNTESITVYTGSDSIPVKVEFTDVLSQS